MTYRQVYLAIERMSTKELDQTATVLCEGEFHAIKCICTEQHGDILDIGRQYLATDEGLRGRGSK